MASEHDSGDWDSDNRPKLTAWQRFRLRRFENRPSMFLRLRDAMVKPPDPEAVAKAAAAEPQSLEEYEAAVKSTSDRERIIGLVAAPLAAAIGFLIVDALINNDPAATLADGLPNKLHVNVSLYHEVLLVLLGVSVLMLVMAMLRKRLYLGMVMALYGLTVFNLHYWGFGIPFLMGGAWYLVRAYRLNRGLKEARGDAPRRPGALGSRASNSARPSSNKRYTPPRPSRRTT